MGDSVPVVDIPNLTKLGLIFDTSYLFSTNDNLLLSIT